jgi:hypothetical protein
MQSDSFKPRHTDELERAVSLDHSDHDGYTLVYMVPCKITHYTLGTTTTRLEAAER